MNYFRFDSQLRDILVTGGDAFMSSNHTLSIILDQLLDMAEHKIQDNKNRPEGKKYAEIVRVRLGTRLPAYLPQRFTPELIKILSDFKIKASKIGIQQFFIQTHFVSPLEITLEAKKAVKSLLGAGWLVTNQEVFTTASSRRGHSAKLRQALNDIGIFTYYTFQVKGHRENKSNFTPVSRSIQEMLEEKKLGLLSMEQTDEIVSISSQPKDLTKQLASFRKRHNVSFLATDRSVFNLPGVGKSLNFRVIGLTNDGRRILEFEYDTHRRHSPIIDRMGKIVIIESKSVSEYLQQLKKMGENISEYQSMYGYSAGISEDRFPLYEYPAYKYKTTNKITNLKI
jgi:lysine 2,3-aminomutase